MERWAGRVAVVTGASAGIGAAIAKDLVKHGMKVVGIARRVERVEALKNELKGAPGTLYPLKADVTKEEDIVSAFKWIKKNLGGVDVLVNNAGIAGTSTLHEGPVSSWQTVWEVNVLGLSICTKEALQSMKERGVDDGHIIHINSIIGHELTPYGVAFGLVTCSGTKHAVTALTEGLRRELVQRKSNIRISAISPGLVRTELLHAAGYKSSGGKTIDELYDASPHLKSEDISSTVLYILGTPPHVQVHEIIIKPVGEAFCRDSSSHCIFTSALRNNIVSDNFKIRLHFRHGRGLLDPNTQLTL